MIKLFTSLDYFDKRNVIVDNDSFFINNIFTKCLSEKGLEIIKEIDKAEVLDKKTGAIKTPYGITSLNHLSTGCKTALNVLYLCEHPSDFPRILAVDATECGSNAIDVLLECLDQYDRDLSIIIEHNNDLYKCKERDYLVDNSTRITNLLYFR